MRILVADDQPVFRRLIHAALTRAGHQVTVVENGQQAWDALTSSEFDLAVLDWMMPQVDGPTVCRKLRGRASARYLYIILLTARDKLEDVVSGLDAGADEYLVKPFNPEELRARVRAGGRIVDLERRLSQTNLQLAMLASTDELTGLLNRRAILQHLDEATHQCLRNGARLSIVMLDLDGFKETNDAHGHAAGDALLQQVAQRLAIVLRPHHRLGRLGGDEFLALLPCLGETEAQAIAEQMRASLSAHPLSLGGNLHGNITGAFGVAELEPRPGADADLDHALLLADQALYQAKRAGGNRVIAASSFSLAKQLAPSSR